MKEYVFPKKIVAIKGGDGQSLLKKQALQIGLNEGEISSFEKDGYVILDFGKERCGGVRILTFTAKLAPTRIRFGESISECCSELGGETNATNDHSNRDFTVELRGLSDMTFGQTGFRFVRLDFSGAIKIKSVVAESYLYKKKPIYSYNGSDKRIDEIFKTAKHTIDLCVSKGYLWDGVKRDRLVWIGDIHPEMLALTSLYGRMKEIERSLDFIKAQTPLPAWMNGMPMYSLWWIIIVSDYCFYTQAFDFGKRQIEYMGRLLEQMLGCVAENGELAYPSYFVDWPTCGKADEIQGCRAINIIAVKKAIEFFKFFGEDTSTAEILLERLQKISITVSESKQVLGLKYFAVGLNDEDRKKLLNGGAKGMSTFMSYYVLTAVASFNKAAAIDMLKEYYGAMLDKGATSFWEDFDIEWTKNSSRIDQFPKEGERDIHGEFGGYCYKGFRHSLCHGWSAGVIRFIQEHCE